MSITSIERLTERGGSLGAHSKISQTYLVRTNSREDGYFEVRQAVEDTVGSFLSAHPSSQFYTRREITLSAPSALHWTAKVTWSTEPVSSQDREREQYPNPIDRRLRISIASQLTQKYVWKDLNDAPLVNKAKDPIDPLPMDFTDVIVNLKANIPTYDATWVTKYVNSTNEADVTMSNGKTTINLEAGYGLIKSMSISELQEDNGYEFYVANLSVHVTHDEEYQWKTMVINEGFNYLDGTDLIPIYDKDVDGVLLDGSNGDAAVKVTSPRKLDADGAVLADEDDPVLLEFELYKRAAWADLPFFS